MPRMSFVVSLIVPKELSRDEVASYIGDSVNSGKGLFNPGTVDNELRDRDPFCDLHSVKVTDRLMNTVYKP